jgi:3-hydroxymyristoyl/3-hydroxydecanoyl-(acyl carrier protein) dehydratase
MIVSCERWVPADHPSLAGHFPGRPLVPGVVLLEEVVLALAALRGEARLVAVVNVKFLAPLGPGEAFTVSFRDPTAGDVTFRCQRAGQVLAQGRLTVE